MSSGRSGRDSNPPTRFKLLVACVAMVIGFRSSTNLAAAYGVAVTMTIR